MACTEAAWSCEKLRRTLSTECGPNSAPGVTVTRATSRSVLTKARHIGLDLFLLLETGVEGSPGGQGIRSLRFEERHDEPGPRL